MQRVAKVRWAAFGAAAMLFTAGYVAHGQFSRKVPVAQLYAATSMPDRIILTWDGDPSTTAAVTWRSSSDGPAAKAEIAVSEDGPLFPKKAQRIDAASETLENAAYHSVRFAGLQPDTQYVYRVGDGANWSEWNQFRTTAAGPAALEFLYVGDAQNDIFDMWSRLIRQGYSDAPKARFILHAGDLVNSGVVDSEWGEWHAAAGWINRSVFSVPTPGNHEYHGVKKALTPHWAKQFTLPRNGIKGLEESNYFLDIQGVRIVSLNSNEHLEEQAAWLEQTLANNPNAWTVLTFHHPMFSTAKGRDNKDLRVLWQPVIDKYKVDLVLTGHDHSYGRSNLVTGQRMKDGATVYVVSVSGPKQYNLDNAEWMHRAAEDTQLYQIVRIDGAKLQYEARTARGVLYDAFDLTKTKGKPNVLVNRTPKTPENRRKPGAAKAADE